MATHDLRPSFTNNLINLLRKETSINLIAPVGYGRKRLLENIKNSRLLTNTKIVLVDMKEYTTNYDGLMQMLCRQLKLSKKPIEFEELITQLEKQAKPSIFLLYNFDELLNNSQRDKKFNINFFNQLAKITRQSQILLVCVTSQPYDKSIIFVENHRHRLDLKLSKQRLPKLTRDEITVELRSRHVSLTEGEWLKVIHTIQNHAQCYSLLKFFANKLKKREDNKLEISLRIEQWCEQFTLEKDTITTKKVTTIHEWLSEWATKIAATGQNLLLFFSESFKFVGNWFIKKM
ncbi:hypothetical protein BGP_4219 [Beggiatoa sp. PS]|nr:hypothetical protein BGP_4219 [Beggiatoa sp. PS]